MCSIYVYRGVICILIYTPAILSLYYSYQLDIIEKWVAFTMILGILIQFSLLYWGDYYPLDI